MLSFPHNDEIIVVRVEGLADRRGPYEEARQLYTDLSGSLLPAHRAPPSPTTGALTSASPFL